jgi:hypothetical protein
MLTEPDVRELAQEELRKFGSKQVLDTLPRDEQRDLLDRFVPRWTRDLEEESGFLDDETLRFVKTEPRLRAGPDRFPRQRRWNDRFERLSVGVQHAIAAKYLTALSRAQAKRAGKDGAAMQEPVALKIYGVPEPKRKWGRSAARRRHHPDTKRPQTLFRDCRRGACSIRSGRLRDPAATARNGGEAARLRGPPPGRSPSRRTWPSRARW